MFHLLLFALFKQIEKCENEIDNLDYKNLAIKTQFAKTLLPFCNYFKASGFDESHYTV